MSKALKNRKLLGQTTLLALTLSTSLAAFGCTTDRTLGNGDPSTMPGLRTSPTSGNSTGSETAPAIPPPMISSSGIDSRPAIRPRRLSNEEVALFVAEHRPRVQVLGPVSPGVADGYYSEGLATGQFVNPALQTNPQLSVNSSISSQPAAVISSGAGVAVDAAAFALNAAATVAGTNGAVVVPAGGAAVTPTGAAIGVPVGAFATPEVSPTLSSSLAPAPTVSSSPILAAQANGRLLSTPASFGSTTLGTTTTTRTSTARSVRTAGSTLRSTASGSANVSNPVRMITSADGRVTVTNNGSQR